jgi:uncharacterized membrane protein
MPGTTALDGASRDLIAVVLGLFITVAGVTHFTNPAFFDAIVPPWLPPGERFWTYASGVAELVIGPMLLSRRFRHAGAIAAIVLFIAVYPGNLYMTWDYRDHAVGEQIISWVRLPFQFLFIWLAWRVAARSRPASPWPGQL